MNSEQKQFQEIPPVSFGCEKPGSQKWLRFLFVF